MATATYSRHSQPYAPHKTLPITMPSKGPAYPSYPGSRVAMSPPELSDASTTYSGSRHSGGSYSARSSSSYAPSQSSDYDYYNSTSGVDVMDMLSERMNSAFDPIKMDRSLARQTQTSGELNSKNRELAELQAMAQRRLKGARTTLAEGMAAGREARRDLEYTSKKLSSMKSKASSKHPEAYAKASKSRSRHDRDY